MRAKLKNLVSSDIDLRTYCPEKEDEFGFYVQAIIGPESEEGGEVFGFQVCSPKWLLKQHSSKEIMFCRSTIIAFIYDFDAIHESISRFCEKFTGKDWDKIAADLSAFGDWEFENYKPLE